MAKQKISCQGCFIDRALEQMYFGLIILGIVIIPLLFSLNTQELFEFPKIIAFYLLTSVAACLWLGRMIITKSLILPKSPLDLPVIIFLITQLVATLFSIHQYTSIFGYYSRFNGGLMSTIAYSLIYFSLAGSLAKLKVNNVKLAKKLILYLILSLIISGLISAIYAIPEKFGYSFSCVFATGELTTNCWKESTNPRYRIFGTFGQPNWLAAFLITVWPIALLPTINHLFDVKKRGRINWRLYISLLSSGVFIWALWLTDSRSGLLGFFGSTLLLTILLILIRQTLTKPIKIIFVGLTCIALLISGTLGWNWWQQSQDLQPSLGGSDSGAIRKVVWRGAYLVWKNNLWLGTGPETFAYSYYLYRPTTHNMLSEWDFLYNKAHNEWLNLLANTGLIGFFGFALVQIATGYLGLRIITKKSETADEINFDKTLAAAILAGLFGLQISNFFGFSTVTVSFIHHLLMAILVYLGSEDFFDQKIKQKLNEKLSFIQILMLFVLIMVLISTIKTISNIWQADLKYSEGNAFLKAGRLEEGSEKIIQAINYRPQEALFYDSLSDQYASYAQSLAEKGEAAAAEELAAAALLFSNTTLSLNPFHLNFYKTQVRALSKLASIHPESLNQALVTINKARLLAPSDPKLAYNQGKILLFIGEKAEGMQKLEEALELKPNYPEPRFELALALYQQGKLREARENYQYVINNLNPSDELSNKQIKIIDASLAAQLRK